MEKKEGLFDFEDEMEDRWIEQRIEDMTQEFVELQSSLSEDQRKIYDVLSEARPHVEDRIHLMRSLLSDYEIKPKTHTGEN